MVKYNDEYHITKYSSSLLSSINRSKSSVVNKPSISRRTANRILVFNPSRAFCGYSPFFENEIVPTSEWLHNSAKRFCGNIPF